MMILVIFYAHINKAANGKTIYVDPQIKSNMTDTYDPDRRVPTGGQWQCFKDLKSAAGSADPGDTVLIRAGIYAQTLKPEKSGTLQKPITYKRYQSEPVTITGKNLEPAIDLSGTDYIIIEGLTITDVKRWLYAVDSHYNVLRNNHFFRALDENHSSKTGAFFQQATFNQILDNTFEESEEDSLTLVKSDRNRIQGNRFTNAHHALWAIRCGNYNVLRNNYFSNPNQKIGEIYDCERAGFDHSINEQKRTRYNLIEGNVFAGTKYSSKSWYYNAIQYGAQNGIVRRNIFYNNRGGALALQVYPAESLYNLDNHVYHNVFFSNHHAGIIVGRGGPNNLSGNIFKNNILYRNEGENSMPTQIMLNGQLLLGYSFSHNDIMGRSKNENVINHMGRFDPLAWWQTNTQVFTGNLSEDPLFVDEARYDFHLKSKSPIINQGDFLTRTRTTGKGKVIPVEDAGYFYDGFQIPGESGDWIQLEGQTKRARITKVDNLQHTIFLDVPLDWTQGQGVSLPYQGSHPDPGAYEFDSTIPQK
jgi:hypothetical protein